jgi:MFS family permease
MKELLVALVATIGVQVVSSMAIFAPAVLAPAASVDIGVAATAIGAFSALNYLMASISAPLGGALVPQHGAVRACQASIVISGCGLIICGLAHPLFVIAGAVLIGVGYGPVTPASSALLIDRTPPRLRNLIMSIRQSGVPIGGAVTGAVVPWLLVATGWRMTVLIVGVASILLAFALQPLRRAYDHPNLQPASRRPQFTALLRMVVQHAELRRVSITSFGFAGMQMCFASYHVVFLTGPGGLSVVAAGAALSAAMIAGIVGRIVWGSLADYTGRARLILSIIGVVTALCSVAMIFVTPAWPYGAVLLLSVLFGASAVGWNGVYVAEVARIAPRGQVAVATGASLALTYFGAVVAPFVFWLIVTATGGYTAAYAAGALFTLAAALSLLRRIPDTPAQ